MAHFRKLYLIFFLINVFVTRFVITTLTTGVNTLMKRFMLIALTIVASAANSESLESLGWKKQVDDFEGTTKYLIDTGNYAYGCGGSNATATFGLVMGEPKKIPLTITIAMYGIDEPIRNAKIKAKTKNGVIELQGECSNEYDDGYDLICIAFGITNVIAEDLKTTDFIRINGSKNVDIRKNNKCASVIAGVNKVASDYLKVQ